MKESPIIVVRNLTKRYDDFVAVDGISFEVQRGEIFGIVGPNGAGKTSAVEAIMGLRPFEGEVQVLGLDTARLPIRKSMRLGLRTLRMNGSIWGRLRFMVEAMELK